MAIEINKRKRKIKGNGDDIPNKKLKSEAVSSPPEELVEENHEAAEMEETANDSGFEADEENIKFSTDFKMLNFRTKLRGQNFITELRHFLYLANVKPQIVAKYIEKRGKPLELAEALERIDKANTFHVSYLCQALHLVIMEILSNQKTHMESAVHACRYFLKSHGAVIETLLKSSNPSHRRCALKLLTAFVCTEPQLGRQLLSSFDILSNVKAIDNFLSHSKYEINEEDTVRKCFIHFILAYLVDGNTLLIRNVLDKGILIKALASGLLFDDHVTVCVVLSTLKKYVLECPDISKTKKVHVFDVDCVRSFARLYDWLGPKGFAAKFTNKKGSTAVPSIEELKKYADPAERQAVAEAVHEFLMLLLTSRKYGITFDAMLHFQQRHNKVQGKIIGFLDKPWMCERKTELVLKILKTCPDLARQTVRHFGALVNPIRTPSHFWVVTCEFIVKIIDAMHPSLLKGALEKITLTDFSHWIKDICLPIEVLMHITGSRALKHGDYRHRLTANRLLLAMFRQYANYMTAIIDREQLRKNNLRRFKFDLLNHIFVNFPPVEDILYSLYETIKTQEKEGVDVLEHLEVTLDLVLIICQHNRSFVNKTATIMDYLNLLRPLYSSDEDEGNIKLELKAIKTMLLLFPKALEPHEKLFANIVKSFINVFVRGDGETQREAGELLRGIFLNTGIFSTGELEIDIWLEALRFVDPATVDIVTAVFIEVLQVTEAEVSITETTDVVPKQRKQLVKLFSNIENGLSVQGYIETFTASKLYPLILKGVEIGEELGTYLNVVKMLLTHYLQSSSEQKVLATLNDEAAKLVPYLSEVREAVLDGENKFQEMFPSTVEEVNEFLKNERLVMIYIQEVLFLVSQLVRTESLTVKQSGSAADFAVNLLNTMKTLCGSEKAVVSLATDENQDQEVELTYLEKTLKYVFNTQLNVALTTNIFVAENNNLNYLKFLQQIVHCVHAFELKSFVDFTTNFRQKIVKSIEMATVQDIESLKQQTEALQPAVHLIEAFQLSTENCLVILEHLSTLSYKDFLTTAGQKTIFLDILIIVLARISDARQSVKCNESVLKIFDIYTDIVTKSESDANPEQLEDALYNFLLICHQCIVQISPKVLPAIFEHRKLTKSTIRLACLLFDRDPQLVGEFAKALPKNITKKELIYPLLNIGIKHGIQLEDALWSSIYAEYKNGFMKTIEKPQKAGVIYKDNVETSMYLIDTLMPKSECIDFCNKNIKFDSVEMFQVKIIRTIFRKALASIDDSENSEVFSKIFLQYVNLSVQMLTTVLKKDVLDEEKIDLIAFSTFDWLRSDFQHVDYKKLLNSQSWINFCKTLLKTAMYISETEEDHSTVDRVNGKLLKFLAFLSDRLYEDKAENPEAGQLFEMTFTHSKFFNIVLQVHPTMVKTQTMHLLLVLAKKCPTALEAKQIPVILGAYQAKLSDCDRYILALLQLYEDGDVGLHKYRPFIWGESATAFYSLREEVPEKANLEHQETSVAQVMALVDRQVSEYTLDNFPIWRKLNHSTQLPSVVFEDPDPVHFAPFGSNSIERQIEQGVGKFEDVELRICPKRDGLYDECYDPAFIVPLMSLCFAPDIYTQPVRPVQNGLLSVVFAALSSQDKEMRMAAGCVQIRYRQHFENSKFFEKPLWVQAYDNIQNGLDALRSDWLKHKKNGGIPRVPYISGLFLAKTINMTTEPTHTLYKQLTMFLRLKDTFNFLCVPEFNVLFHSPEVNHHNFRQFIVEIIRNGVKSSSDLFLLVTTNTFKALMGFYASSMSTLDINLQILSALSTCVKIPGSSKIMIEHVGIIPWINGVLTAIEFYHFDVIEGIISIISNLWYAIKANAKEFHNYQHIESDISRLILKLLPNLSGRISPSGFAKLVNVLNKTTSERASRVLTELQLDRLIKCAQKLYGDELFVPVINIMTNGADGAENAGDFCKQLANVKTETTALLAVCSLREFVIKWCRSNVTVSM